MRKLLVALAVAASLAVGSAATTLAVPPQAAKGLTTAIENFCAHAPIGEDTRYCGEEVK